MQADDSTHRPPDLLTAQRLPEDATLQELIAGYNELVEWQGRRQDERRTVPIEGPAPVAFGKDELSALDGVQYGMSELAYLAHRQAQFLPGLAHMDFVGVSGNDSDPNWLEDKLPDFDATDDLLGYTVLTQDDGAHESLVLQIEKTDVTSTVASELGLTPGDYSDTEMTVYDTATGKFKPIAQSSIGAATQTNALLDGSSHTDTAASAVNRGDLIVGNFTPAWDDLALGSATHILTSNGSDIVWAAPVTQTSALLDGTVHTDTAAATVTQGSLIYGNSTPAWDELVVGTAGQVLAVNAGATEPEWQANPMGSGLAAGFIKDFWFDITGDMALTDIDATIDYRNRIISLLAAYDSGAPTDGASMAEDEIYIYDVDNTAQAQADGQCLGRFVWSNPGAESVVPLLFVDQTVSYGDFYLKVDDATGSLQALSESFSNRYNVRVRLVVGRQVAAAAAIGIS